MANPFEVTPANPLQALMMGVQGYDRSSKLAKQAEQDAVYKQIGEQIQSGGLNQSALGQLFGLGPSGAPMVAAAAALLKSKQEGSGVYGTPIYGTLPDGSMALGAIGKNGTFQKLDTGNVTPTPGVGYLDTGTGYLPYNKRSGVTGAAAVPGAPQGVPTGAPGQAVPSTPKVWGDQEAEAAGLYDTPGQPPQQAAARTAPGMVPKDVEGAARAKKLGFEEGDRQADLGRATSAVATSVSNLERLKMFANRVKADPALDSITGFQGIFPNWPGGKAANLNAQLETLKSQIGFGALQAMRDASKTGGALGSVSDAEGKRLENNLAALDRAQDAQSFKRAMDDIIKYADDVIPRIHSAYQQDYGRLRNGAPAQQSQNPQPRQQTQQSGAITREQYQALPSGSAYIAPDGSPRIKQ